MKRPAAATKKPATKNGHLKRPGMRRTVGCILQGGYGMMVWWEVPSSGVANLNGADWCCFQLAQK